MFNARQLLYLPVLASDIDAVADPVRHDLLTGQFSGTLTFNNLFTSYNGKGTGASPHMFAHYVLKPEQVPLEGSVWGTPKSSGLFSTIFQSRIRRALDYAVRPFELRPEHGNGKTAGEKVVTPGWRWETNRACSPSSTER